MLVPVEEFNYWDFAHMPLQKRKRGNSGTRQQKLYKDIIATFDIETSRLRAPEQSIMYTWAMQINDVTLVGRTWEQWLGFMNQLKLYLLEDEYLVIWVHNLSYEFQFMAGVYDFKSDEVFALKSRKVAKCEMFGCFEFRCSYIHSNMSLGEYTKKMQVEHQKLDGDEFDYSVIRYPWTKLSPRKMEYIINDVLGLAEAIKKEMELDGDTLYTIPLTSTGYVRRDAKRAMRTISHNYVRNQLIDYEVYKMLREEFRGGNTHASRYFAGLILYNVKSADRSSSYPEVLCNCLYPVSEFFHMGEATLEEVKTLITKRKKAVLMRVRIKGLRLRNERWGCPYISRDKSRFVVNGDYDNGRILSADYLEMTINDIDLKIILDEYDFDDMQPFDVFHARYGKLPPPLIKVIIKYYVDKTALKDVEGQEVYYTKAKNKLNAIYGMMAQDPVKQDTDFFNGEWIEHTDDEQELLAEHNKKAFLCYQWGAWCTAHARYMLEEGIKIAGDGFVYCDTDSVKYLGDVSFEEYNKGRIKASKESGAFATDTRGTTHYMGVYEQERTYMQFKTLGAKKYAYVYDDGKLGITVSGVDKKKGAKELAKAGGLKAFEPGFVFVEGGGTEAIYNDVPEVTEVQRLRGKLAITRNVTLKDSTYTLGITGEYERLLRRCGKL